MRSGKPAPGDPGGLAASKPIEQAKAKKFDPKKRSLDQVPAKWVDDPANFDDGKTNKTRLVGTWARFATGSEGRTKKQLHRWCVCDQSKANKDSAAYPGHFASTQVEKIRGKICRLGSKPALLRRLGPCVTKAELESRHQKNDSVTRIFKKMLLFFLVFKKK